MTQPVSKLDCKHLIEHERQLETPVYNTGSGHLRFKKHMYADYVGIWSLPD